MNRQNIEAIYKLTPMQQGMLMHTLMAPESAAYFDQFVFPVGRRVGPERVAALFEELVSRNGILRTSFLWGGKLAEPVQVVHKKVEMEVQVLDWSDLDEEAMLRQLQIYCAEDRQRGFEMKRAPLMRLTIILTSKEMRVVWSYHHILLDGWSAGNAVKELFARLLGKPASTKAPRPFKDYIGWLQSKDPAVSDAYWKRTLGGFDTPTPLPFDKASEAMGTPPTGGFERNTVLLPADLESRLNTVSRDLRATPFTFIQVAWGLTLGLYSGLRDVVFGITLSGRPAALKGVQDMLGCFINTLPVRLHLDRQMTAKELITSQQKRYFELLEHEHSHLARVHQFSEVGVDQPLFDCILVAETFVPIRDYDSFQRTNYPLTVMVRSGAEGTDLGFGFDLDRFDPAAVQRLHDRLVFFLGVLVDHLDAPLEQLPLVSEAERQQLLVEWDGRPQTFPLDEATIHGLVSRQAGRHGERVALLDGAGTSLTYAELEARANRLAHYLQGLGVGPERLVGVCMERSCDLVVALLAVLKAGGAYLPLDLAYPEERLAFMLEDAGARWLISTSDLAEGLPDFGGSILYLDGPEFVEVVASQSDQPPSTQAHGDSLAYVIYTSGSTGRPKGVLIPHRNVARLLAATDAWFHFGPDDCWTFFHSHAFDFSVWEIWGALATGGRVLAVPYWVSRSPEAFYDLLRDEGVTVLNQTPSAFRQLVEVAGKRPEEDRLQLREVIFGGEALDLRALAPWYQRYADDAPRLVNMYGITETTVHVTYRPLSADEVDRLGSPVGRAIPDLSLHVLDDVLRPLPVGVAGELFVGGAGVARGYLGRPSLTAQRFVPDPYSEVPGSRLYRSGDLARYEENGDLDFLGRIDHQVKVRGFRIELGEIESALEDLESIRQAVVLALPGSGGSLRLVAYVIPEGEVEVESLRAALGDRLPDYMVPSAFVSLDAFPLTANGKLDRKALPAPEEAGQANRRQFVAPRTETEQALAAIWSDLLEVEQVGVEDHFFELGGHSLVVTQVASRIRQDFEVELSLPRIFDRPLLADLALEVDMARQMASQKTVAPPLKPLAETAVDRQALLSAGLPLSFAQERLWFLDQLMPGNAYNIPGTLRLRGALDVDLFRQALQHIVQRHETLRTYFTGQEGKGRQHVADAVELDIPLVDLSADGLAAAERRLKQLTVSQAATTFDLSQAPLMQVQLAKLAQDDHAAVVVMHHVVSDGWSLGVLLRELQEIYDALAEGRPHPLPELPIQYADFTAWQRSWLESGELDRQMEVWKARLEGAPTILDLPTDRPVGSTVDDGAGGLEAIQWPRSLLRQLEDYGRKRGVTPFMVVLATFQTLLGRLSGQDVVLVGSPIANRTRMETEGLIGFFVNTLVMRGDLHGPVTFEQLFLRSRETTLEAYANQDVPFEKLVDTLAPDRSLDHSPLFQVLFSLQKAPPPTPTRQGLVMEPMGEELGSAKFPINLEMHEHEEGVVGLWNYSKQLFDGITVRRFSRYLENLLRAALADDSQRIDQVSMLTATERHQLLVEWDGRPAASPVGSETIHGLVTQRAEEDPSRWALLDGSGGHLTYGELEARANQLAHRLRQLGAGPERLVGLCLDRSMDLVVALLAVLKSGAAYLPIDVAYPKERLAFMLEDSGACLLISSSELQAQLPAWQGPVVLLDDGAEQARLAELPSSAPDVTVRGEHLAYVIYTSGSTGRPKGVLIPHHNAVRLLTATQDWFHFGPQDTWTFFHSHAFDFSVWEIWGALATGGRLVAVPYWVSRSPQAFYELLRDQEVTVLNQTPSAFRQLVEVACAAPAEERLALREVIFGGEALDLNALAPWFERYGDEQPRLVNMYGITETTVHVTYRPLSRRDLEPTDKSPVGQAIPDLALQVLDRGGQPQPIGVAGEIHVGGAGLARGYLGRPALTAERFVPDPFSAEPGARLYRSGDLARYLVDGDLDFLGRIDHQVKIRGFRIELGEIEATLEDLASIQRAVVLALPSSGGDLRLVAYLQESPDGAVTIEELRQSLEERLPAYMVPSAFVPVTSWPLTANGKLDRRALPDPDAERLQVSGAYQAPSGPVEEALVKVWQEILGVDRVGVHDNFFDLGGHSLLATQVVARLQQVENLDVPLRMLFEVPTVAGLAARLEAAQGEIQRPPLVPLSDADRSVMPLSFAQERLWFLDQLMGRNAVYNIVLGARLIGDLKLEVLERALNCIVERHETLRSHFAIVDGAPEVRVAPELHVPLRLVDLGDLQGEAADTEVRRRLRLLAMEPFELDAGPLLRVNLLRYRGPGGEAEHVASVAMHHTISDGWSMQLLLRELGAFYGALLEEQDPTSAMPPLLLQYGDFAAWQRGWLQGEALEQQLEYWRGALGGAPAALELPTDRPHPPVSSYAGGSVTGRLDRDLAESLKAFSQRHGATLFMTLMAGFQILLARLSGQRDISVGTPIANRQRMELEGIIGFFANTLVMRGQLQGRQSMETVVEHMREVALGAYAHQDVPFEKLVAELAPDRDLSQSPLFQVMLVLQNAAPAAELPGLELEQLPPDAETSQFDLNLTVVEQDWGLGLSLTYKTELYDAATAERFLGQLERLLRAAMETPDQPIETLPVMSASERQQVLVEWNDTAHSWTEPQLLTELLQLQAKVHPERTALVFEGQEMTYAELHRRSRRLAAHLQGLGVGPDVRVGLCIERSLDMVVALLGILEAGGAYVPVDPEYPQDRVAFMLEDMAAPVWITASSVQEVLPAAADDGPHRVLMDELDWDGLDDGAFSPPSISPNNLAYVIYTSGSTGRPKGAMNSHGAIVNRILWMQQEYGLTAEDRVLQKTPFSFDVSVWEFFWPLITGSTLVVARPGGHRDPGYLVSLIAEQQVTTLHFVPSMLQVFLQHPDLEPCRGLRHVIASGEALPVSLVDRFYDRLGSTDGAADGPRLHNLYGPTEAAVDVTYWPTVAGAASIPIGQPVSNTRLYVLGPDLRPVPRGSVGELMLGGVQLARGYHGRPGLTAERFIPDPFAASDEAGCRLYRTGDLVSHRADGLIEYHGRLDFQVKIRGFRIELGEIEAALESHQDVRQALVLALPLGGGELRLVAYVMPTAGVELTVRQLRQALETSLPDYMVPALFVLLEEFPLLPNGKVDRKALPEPGSDRSAMESEYVEPRNDVEAVLAEVWQGILRVDQVGVHDNFFELGGDSILSIQAIARAKERGLELQPQYIFQQPTVAGLAELLGESGHTVRFVAEQGPVTGTLPLSPSQRRYFNRHPATPGQDSRSFLMAAPRLDADALQNALVALMDHHDQLRAVFVPTGDGVRQEIQPPGLPAPYTSVDLSEIADVDRPAALRDALQTAVEAARGRLDLDHGPLIQWVHLRDVDGSDPDEGDGALTDRLLVVVHPLVADDDSWPILRQDLERAYDGEVSGRGADLGPKTTSFKAWSERLNDWAAADPAPADRPEMQLLHGSAEAPPTLPALPVDQDGTPTDGLDAWVGVDLDPASTEALLLRVPAAYRTETDDVLVTALAEVLAAWTGQRQHGVEVKASGRLRPSGKNPFDGGDVTRTVGPMTSSVPLFLELPPAGDWGASLKTVKEALRSAAQQGVGFDALRHLGAPSTRQRLDEFPVPRVGFTYLGGDAPSPGQAPDDSARFVEAPEGAGMGLDANGGTHRSRGHLLDVVVSLSEAGLHMRWFYSDELHDRQTVETLATSYLEALQALIDHCTADGVGGYTPSDFPLAGLDQPQLDALLGDDREVEDLYPLSPLQKGLLVHALAVPGSYFQQMHFSYDGALDPERFRRAWERLLQRHAILRTAFLWRDLEQPLQLVRPQVPLEIQYEDWRHIPAQERHQKVVDLLVADRRRGFELETAPLLRLLVLRLDEAQTQVVFSHHHLLLDGWSTPLLLREVFAGYGALSGDAAATEALNAIPAVRPFGEYIGWLERQDQEAQEQFWSRYLDGFENPTPLFVSRRERAWLSTGDGSIRSRRAYRKRRLSGSFLETLQRQTQQHQVTLNTLVQGIWALILGRASAESDVVFGATVSGRNAPLKGMETMLGLFINTLPVRVRLQPEQSVQGWLAALQRQQGEAANYEHSSLMEVQGWSAVRRPQALFESLLAFENYPMGGMDQMGDVGVEEMDFHGGSDYPLALSAVPTSDFLLSIGYDVERFDDATVERVLGHLVAALEGYVERPEATLQQLPLLTAVERHQLLVEWNRSDVEHRLDDPLVHRPVWRQAAETPQRPAVIYDDQELSYGELTERARQLAQDLRRRGIGPEDVVAVHMERSFELIVAYLAVLHTGAAYLPLDPGFPGDRLDLMVQDADVRVLLTHGTLQQDWLSTGEAGASVHVQRLETVRPGNIDAPAVVLSDVLTEIDTSGVRGDHPAYVIYTSGSTGKPKGVVVPHRAVANRLAYDGAYDVDGDTRYLQNTAVGFDMSVPTIFSPLWVGGCTVLVKAEEQQDPKAILHLMARQRVNRAGFPPQMLSLMLEDPALDEVPDIGFVGSGGDAISADLPRRFYERLPEAKLLNRYGPTEATVAVTSWLFPQHEAGDGPPPIGRPMVGAHIDLVDRWFQPVPVGVPGELLVSGVCLARGYLGDPARTAERFVPNPFATSPGERVYRTGDLAVHRPDGAIEFLGRIDHQVKIRGFRVELGEIEAQLVAHPSVRRAAVIDVGSGDLKQLVAYVVGHEDQEMDAQALARFLGESLPDYMVPSAFVPLDELPVSRTGKVDRKQLPEPSQSLPTTLYVEPQGPWEEAVAELFAEMLGRDRVGSADDFFVLGGQSLMAARVVTRLRSTLGVDVPLGDLFAHSRVDALARHLEFLAAGGGAAHDPVLLPLQVGSGPALFCVHPVAGVALCYRDLAAALDDDRTLIGIQSPALRGEDLIHDVGALASRYLEAIRTHQPEGPYELAGWSFGGLVAYDMARQLQAAGEHVTFLGLFDTVLAESKEVNEDLDDMDRLIEAVRQFLGARADDLAARLAALEPSQRRTAFEGWLASEAGDLEITVADLDRYVEVQKSHEVAFRNYRPQPYEGAVAFFEAETRAAGVDDPVTPWRPLVGRMDVYPVGGSHENMVFAPHSEGLAAALDEARDAARSREVTPAR